MIKDRTWAEVNLDNIAFNHDAFKRLCSNSKVMCVLKANAYGHGATALATFLQLRGCDFFATAMLDEALELCRHGINTPILILNCIHPTRIPEVFEFTNIRLTIISLDGARAVSEAAEAAGVRVKVHVKLDTGMTRIGFNADEAAYAFEYISGLPGLELEGAFTHFAVADEPGRSYTEMQFQRFMELVPVEIPFKHVCNSAAAIMYPEMHLDMVRLGISLYGCYPSEDVDKSRVELKPAMALKTRIVRINVVEPGISVGYGRRFTAQRRTRLATIPIGYADGLSRLMTKLYMLVNGTPVPIAGRICMDQSVIDVTDAGDVNVLDEVTVYGEGLPVEQAAEAMGTINYEILSTTGRRVPRVYTLDGSLLGYTDYIASSEHRS